MTMAELTAAEHALLRGAEQWQVVADLGGYPYGRVRVDDADQEIAVALAALGLVEVTVIDGERWARILPAGRAALRHG